MKSNSIRDWLNGGRGYAEGLALYEVYGQDTLLLRALRQGYSPYRQGRLVEALEGLMDMAEQPDIAAQEPEHREVTVGAEPMPEAAVEERKDPYRKDWLPLYMEMNALRHKLADAPDDATRGQMAHRILKLERQCMTWWARRDYHLRTGQAPAAAPATEEVTDVNALRLRITNLRTYITKAKALLNDEARKEKAAERLARYSAELSELEKRLTHE